MVNPLFHLGQIMFWVMENIQTEQSLLFTPPHTQSTVQGPKLRLPGRQCDQKFSSGDQNFVVGRQLATGKAGCYCRLSRSEKMIKN